MRPASGSHSTGAREAAGYRDGVSASSARRPVTSVRVRAIDGDRVLERPDKVVTEEPMEIRVHGPGQEPTALAVTMRMPGNDFELAVGFCRTENVLTDVDDLDTVAYCLAGEGEQEYNVVTVRMRRPIDASEMGGERRFAVNASCGLCGKTTLDEIEQHCVPVAPGPTIRRTVIASLPARLRGAQRVFDATGGLHAAATFTPDGTMLAIREDVGRHNALDKLIGHAVLERRVPLADAVLMVSGRVSFEIVQKAAIAGIPVLCAVSAPSSLAVDAAQRFGQTLVGFVRDDRANVYTHPERIDLDG
jgi:FdhD protein